MTKWANNRKGEWQIVPKTNMANDKETREQMTKRAGTWNIANNKNSKCQRGPMTNASNVYMSKKQRAINQKSKSKWAKKTDDNESKWQKLWKTKRSHDTNKANDKEGKWQTRQMTKREKMTKDTIDCFRAFFSLVYLCVRSFWFTLFTFYQIIS